MKLSDHLIKSCECYDVSALLLCCLALENFISIYSSTCLIYKGGNSVAAWNFVFQLLLQAASNMAEVSKESMPHHDKNKVHVEREFDQASFSSDETQTGVKTVEAVSQTWTQSALIAAYLGCVCSTAFLVI